MTGDEDATAAATADGSALTRAGRLFVCAVPIGSLDDASPGLRRVLGDVDVIACEDTRTTRRLMDLLGIAPVPRLLAHHEHNEQASSRGLVELLAQGSDVALVSDAGTPALSDPGVPLVRAAHEAGIEVVAVPGPSAVSAALSVAGIVGDGHRFVGFLPRSEGRLRELLRRGAADVVVAFEAPGRVQTALAVIAAEQPDRELALCREMTKRHEQVVRGTAVGVARLVGDRDPRGECVLVLAPVAPERGAEPVDQTAVDLVVALEGEGLRRRVAARIVADHMGGASSALYDAARLRRERH